MFALKMTLMWISFLIRASSCNACPGCSVACKSPLRPTVILKRLPLLGEIDCFPNCISSSLKEGAERNGFR